LWGLDAFFERWAATGSGMGTIRVSDQHGATHELEAIEGWRVMEVIRDHGLPIEAICGGACACATCHVRVAPTWAGRLAPMRADEEGLLDSLPEVAPTSRLACQIIWDSDLDGLELTLVGGEA
jgi:ferredoxin, 2Fe-2S